MKRRSVTRICIKPLISGGGSTILLEFIKKSWLINPISFVPGIMVTNAHIACVSYFMCNAMEVLFAIMMKDEKFVFEIKTKMLQFLFMGGEICFEGF